MNLLAHAFLSFNNREILTGNMINDYVKGRKKFDYPINIQKGMELHRAIDHFTDIHPVTSEAKKYFSPEYRLYAGAFIDIVYDHFLALDTLQFQEFGGLQTFTAKVYGLLDQEQYYFPLPFQRMFPYMKEQNWLYHYQFKDGIKNAFVGLVNRAKYLTESAIAFRIFVDNYVQLNVYYDEFFPELKDFSLNKYRQLMEQ